MGKLVEVVEVVEMVELVKIDCEKSMKLETSPKVTKSKRNLHWCRSVSNKNTCAFFITVSVKMLLHYRAGSLLQYRAFYYIIGQLLHYRAFFITLSGYNYSIGSYYIIGWYTPSGGSGLWLQPSVLMKLPDLPHRSSQQFTLLYHLLRATALAFVPVSLLSGYGHQVR